MSGLEMAGTNNQGSNTTKVKPSRFNSLHSTASRSPLLRQRERERWRFLSIVNLEKAAQQLIGTLFVLATTDRGWEEDVSHPWKNKMLLSLSLCF